LSQRVKPGALASAQYKRKDPPHTTPLSQILRPAVWVVKKNPVRPARFRNVNSGKLNLRNAYQSIVGFPSDAFRSEGSWPGWVRLSISVLREAASVQGSPHRGAAG
jgi:hypothetical protein